MHPQHVHNNYRIKVKTTILPSFSKINSFNQRQCIKHSLYYCQIPKLTQDQCHIEYMQKNKSDAIAAHAALSRLYLTWSAEVCHAIIVLKLNLSDLSYYLHNTEAAFIAQLIVSGLFIARWTTGVPGWYCAHILRLCETDVEFH